MIVSLAVISTLLFCPSRSALLAVPVCQFASTSGVIDLGMIRNRGTIHIWALIENSNSSPILVKEPGRDLLRIWPTGGKLPYTIPPGERLILDIAEIQTKNFNGPISNSVTLSCDPGCGTDVQLVAAFID